MTTFAKNWRLFTKFGKGCRIIRGAADTKIINLYMYSTCSTVASEKGRGCSLYNVYFFAYIDNLFLVILF